MVIMINHLKNKKKLNQTTIIMITKKNKTKICHDKTLQEELRQFEK